MKPQHATLSSFLTALLLAALLHACRLPADSGGDEERPPQTKILRVLVQPDTVAPGDTARFTCIIKDSTDKRFTFYWYVDTGEVLDAELFDNKPVVYKTAINTLQWVAPEKPKFNSFTVRTDNGSNDSMSVETSFVIIVE